MHDDYYDKELEERVYGYRACGVCILGIFLSLLLALLFSGCASKVVSVPEYHTEYVVRTDSFVQRDSVFVKDSIFVVHRGDSVILTNTKIVFRDRWRDVVRTDTVLRCDTISVVVEVEKELSWWSRQKLRFGGVSVFLVVLLLLAVTMSRLTRKAG